MTTSIVAIFIVGALGVLAVAIVPKVLAYWTQVYLETRTKARIHDAKAKKAEEEALRAEQARQNEAIVNFYKDRDR